MHIIIFIMLIVMNIHVVPHCTIWHGSYATGIVEVFPYIVWLC